MLHDDGASAMTSADERAKPLPLWVVENVQSAVVSLIASMNDVPAEFDATNGRHVVTRAHDVRRSGARTDGLGYISYQA